MGMWGANIKRSLTGLDIKDGELIKCLVKDGTVTIPDVKAVASDAFEGCENVKINYSPEYILSELTDYIYLTLESLVRKFKKHPRIIEFAQPNPCLKIWNIESDNVEDSIKNSIKKIEEENPEIKWHLKTIDADQIADICREIESIGRDNLVQIVGEKVSTLYDIPFLMASPVKQLGVNSDYVNNLMDKEGYGILYVKNLTKENMSSLPDNFIYNLIKSHSFHHIRLSSKWEVVLEIGEGVRFEASLQDIGWIFNGNWYRGLTVENYLNKMKRAGKLIEAGKERYSE